ncbi:MAG: deoxyguanosinetriphosphate triphosphohydrolase [Bauldia sp.]|uniref:deoxyguanosinetriphosphate triphosphohydrolase n=1 Tax=Bauldia sp. TaxID=2575872 RepID=UPI001DEDD4F4|nr:deoxyguanosinetriphosphate triphosphohydrolase [Bauldia sp.]MCB1495326.1 deoxyguanosinetriphosphate triphosphohydrolase [Bauldia sp.]
MLTQGIGFGGGDRSVFAEDPARSRGRLFAEPASPTRTEFQRDRDRVVHSTGFRRLREKTQVFLVDEGDHFRTRLTHTLEVSQIARALARALRLDEDLAEALALAHDIGHPPFGHAGERALDAAMAGFGGFDHNAQSVRVVTRLERRYPRFDGLNLTWETLEGLVKHNGPLTDRGGAPIGRYAGGGIPRTFTEISHQLDLWLWSWPGAEAQAAAIADDIAYDTHDIDDGLRAGLLTLDSLARLELPGRLLREIRAEYPDLAVERVTHELSRRLITRMIEDVIGESLRRLDDIAPASSDDIRGAGRPAIGFSDAMRSADDEIKRHLHTAVYRHDTVMDVMGEAERKVRRLFERYRADPATLPAAWRPGDHLDDAAAARQIADFLAGMTDRYASAEYRRLFS